MTSVSSAKAMFFTDTDCVIAKVAFFDFFNCQGGGCHFFQLVIWDGYKKHKLQLNFPFWQYITALQQFPTKYQIDQDNINLILLYRQINTAFYNIINAVEKPTLIQVLVDMIKFIWHTNPRLPPSMRPNPLLTKMTN